MGERTYIAIDLKSFYASVECAELGLDPLDTNLVVADSSRTEKTICLAVSPSLKAIGIPGRPRLFEVVQQVKTENARRRGRLKGGFTGKSVSAGELEKDPALELDYIVAKPRMNPVFVLLMASLANASFCRLFGGDIWAMLVTFTATMIGFFTRQHLTRRHVNHYIVFVVSAFVASLCASTALTLGLDSAEIALATSVLYLVPGVPLINGVIDIMDGHIQIGISRLVNALMLIVCIAIGMSATLMLVKDSLL